jgi:hypothetical protein
MKETKIREGATLITFSKREMADMDRRIADSRGISLRQYRKLLKQEMRHMCSCDSPDTDNLIFCTDGQVFNEHCVHKHHYHCGRCKKVFQIG